MGGMAKDTLLTVQQVAERLQLNPETIRRWVREGKLRAIKLGSNRGGFRIRESDIRRLTAHS
jgi:excisionase family DNA binding protein